MSYLLSGEYVADNELALSPLDPALGLAIPTDVEPIMSERDIAAPTLAEAAAAGLLPDYATCQKLEQAQWPASR
jgi:epimerase EvaD